MSSDTIRARLVRLLEQAPSTLPRFDGSEIVIYGAGGCGRSLSQAARSRGIKTRAFLDARASAVGEIEGIPCYLPESEMARSLAAEALPVVVAVFNFEADLRPIFQLLRRAGFAEVMSFYQLHEQFGLPAQFWLGPRSLYRSSREDILAAFDLFEDERSRQIFHDYIALRVSFDVDLLAEPDRENHYLAPDLPAARLPMRLIDGGAFTGDSIEGFLDHGLSLEAVAAFEPDPKNFVQLRRNIGKREGQIAEVILLPCGLSGRTSVESFAASAGAASALQAGGTTAVQVVAIDEVLPTFAPTFIKLDIEGAEPDALRGAAKTVARHAPRLAISCYHTPEHLWSLPLLIRELQPAYRLALRYHQFNGFDGVLYAFAP